MCVCMFLFFHIKRPTVMLAAAMSHLYHLDSFNAAVIEGECMPQKKKRGLLL